jgi:hypothetical protein
VRRAVIGDNAAKEALLASDPGASNQSRRRRCADLRLGLVRGGEEGDNEGQIRSSRCSGELKSTVHRRS